eukprot:NODE_3062_length_986_cov_20.808965_g2558_i0.p1 GENE.NODE_3062_length_986_cov_20.808965_g2558_i0~~NODE_3062_length_986_cov_20.808965_g2558_i0.p1  ORF type:complete len:238 (-),score=47.82 NODE_3062_length_986_cov_20.808965_g2558_i0:44-757(-)
MVEVTPQSLWQTPLEFHVGLASAENQPPVPQVKTEALAKRANLICLVFGASWCLPFRSLMPILSQCSRVLKQGDKLSSHSDQTLLPLLSGNEMESTKDGKGKKGAKAAVAQKEREDREALARRAEEDLVLPKRPFEFVYMSYDRTEAEYLRVIRDFPGVSMPYKSPLITQLYAYYQAQGIPTLVVLDTKDGTVVDVKARWHIEEAAKTKFRDLWTVWVPEERAAEEEQPQETDECSS